MSRNTCSTRKSGNSSNGQIRTLLTGALGFMSKAKSIKDVDTTETTKAMISNEPELLETSSYIVAEISQEDFESYISGDTLNATAK